MGKRLIADKFNDGREWGWVHLSAAALAGTLTGTVTGTATNFYLGSKNASSACPTLMVNGVVRYTGLWQTLKLVIAEKVPGPCIVASAL
jgi:hypothetical protein